MGAASSPAEKRLSLENLRTEPTESEAFRPEAPAPREGAPRTHFASAAIPFAATEGARLLEPSQPVQLCTATTFTTTSRRSTPTAHASMGQRQCALDTIEAMVHRAEGRSTSLSLLEAIRADPRLTYRSVRHLLPWWRVESVPNQSPVHRTCITQQSRMPAHNVVIDAVNHA